jgi:hypothetical protein
VSLAYNAVKAARYGDPDWVMSMIYGDAQRDRVSDLLTRPLGKYLRSNLIKELATR